MSDYHFNDYNKFIGKHITVIYDCGSKCKKLHCKLLQCSKKDSKEKFIILKTHNNTIYHMNCNKIIYWTAKYKDSLTENQDAYKSNTKHIESDPVAESEDLLLEKTHDKETTPPKTNIPNAKLHAVKLLSNEKITESHSANFPKENTALIPSESTIYDNLQENNSILSESKNKSNASLSLELINNAVISDERDISYTTYSELNNDEIITDYKKDHNCDKVIQKYNHKDNYKKNILSSSLAAFINGNFQGVHLTIYTTSTQVISGEVIFNYNRLIILKSDEQTYYINPEQIAYFY
ncbi:hypothetical protein [Clostridium sp. BJN0013]|uniref:hypothetical protein n=1 Tax=Clostridium sp. BJN0013 TaxID=3236840 RepID=UPI0034C5D9A9